MGPQNDTPLSVQFLNPGWDLDWAYWELQIPREVNQAHADHAHYAD